MNEHLLILLTQVHILLFGGTVTVNLGADDSGAPVKKEKELVIDQSEFSGVWWNSVRASSF